MYVPLVKLGVSLRGPVGRVTDPPYSLTIARSQRRGRSVTCPEGAASSGRAQRMQPLAPVPDCTTGPTTLGDLRGLS